MADKAFERVHGWFAQAVEAALQGVPDAPGPNPAAARNALRQVLWSLADPVNRNQAPPPASAAAFNQPNVAGGALSIAALVAGETLVAIDPLQKLFAALDDGQLGDAREAISALVNQIQQAAGGLRLYPSAFGVGKLLLTLSGDTGQPMPVGNALRAKKLAELFSNNADAQASAHMAMGINTLLLGAVLDTAFSTDPAATLKDWAGFSADTVANAAQQVALSYLPIPRDLGPAAAPRDGDLAAASRDGDLAAASRDGDLAAASRDGDLAAASRDAAGASITIQGFDPLRGLRVGFAGSVDVQRNDGPTREIVLSARAGGTAELRWDAPGPRLMASNGPADSLGLSLDIALKKRGGGNAGAISIPAPDGDPPVRLQFDEIGAGISLAKPAGGNQLAPALTLRAKGGQLVVKVSDTLLSQVLGPQVTVDFSIEAIADGAGGFRLKDGTALRVNLPIQKLPTGPFKLQLITFAVEPKNNFAQVECELSVSAGIDLGPFKGSVERLGALVSITTASGAVALAFKPPTGLGLSLDAGVVKGGGFLALDPALGEYKGALELQIASISVKALGLLNTKRPGNNWSLLLLIFGNFPPIQLSWGFTLTGVGGLIGVQHTADASAMAQQLGAGGLDAVLFPQDVASNAPQIFETLKTLFPFKPGGFVIGPMLEVGWGTPSLVSLRLGVLIEASQIAILGQLVIQVPPLVDKSLAILRLQIDFVGVIVFDPFKIAFDGKLRDSRVAFITLTGQFAFRAAFGSKPSFLISAGGFHPRFADIPPDVPMPFDRIGAGFSIGIIGVSVKGYFAVTAATVQAGFELKAWGDVGVASFDAGLGFDAICYLQPKFYFEVDFRAWAHAEAFGIGFGVSMSGLLAGPGRWRIRGVGEVDLGFFGSVSVEFDESFGSDTDAPLVQVNAFQLLVDEVQRADNWSVALPGSGDALITVQQRAGDKQPVAHPLAALVFTQRKLPLRRALARVGEAGVQGPDTLDISGLTFNGAPVAGVSRETQREHFAASQFFKMSDDDKLTSPSFELMDAGEKLGADAFEFDPAALVTAPVDWESRDLSPAPASREWLLNGAVLGMLADAHAYGRNPALAGWMLATGAVGRSGLRAAERLRPPDAMPMGVKVQPAAALADKATGALAAPLALLNAAGASAAAPLQAGAWAAQQALALQGTAGVQARLQVVEAYELA